MDKLTNEIFNNQRNEMCVINCGWLNNKDRNAGQ